MRQTLSNHLSLKNSNLIPGTGDNLHEIFVILIRGKNFTQFEHARFVVQWKTLEKEWVSLRKLKLKEEESYIFEP